MQFEILLILQVSTSVLVMVLLKKMMQIKQKMEYVMKEVEGYIAFITEETQEKVDVLIKENEQEERTQNFYNLENKKERRFSRDDAQTQLIQSVLGEYFP